MMFDVAGGSHITIKNQIMKSSQCVREEPNSRSITIAQQMLVLISRMNIFPEIDMAFSLAKFSRT